MSDNVLTVVCTDSRQHPTTQIARFQWTPDGLAEYGFAVWDDEDGAELDVVFEIEPIRENTRTTKGGASRVTSREPIEITTRADGGQTYRLPPCPRCRRRFWLRDDKVLALRHSRLASPDLSLAL